MRISILFFEELCQDKINELTINNAEYSPNIGESVNNEKIPKRIFKVVKKEIFFSSDGASHHVIFCEMDPNPFKIHS